MAIIFKIKTDFFNTPVLLFVYLFLDASMCRACFQAYCMSLVYPPYRTAGYIFLLPLVLEEHQNITLFSIISTSTSSCFSV
jgi:hypothetical protein